MYLVAQASACGFTLGSRKTAAEACATKNHSLPGMGKFKKDALFQSQITSAKLFLPGRCVATREFWPSSVRARLPILSAWTRHIQRTGGSLVRQREIAAIHRCWQSRQALAIAPGAASIAIRM